MTAPTSYSLSGLAVPACIEDLHALFDQVRTAHTGVTEEDLSAFELAIVEIGGNVVQHGKPSGQVRFNFDLRVEPDQLLGLLVDSGEQVPPAGVGETVDELAESGRGLFMARAILDEFRYERRGRNNAWIMVKRRQA